MFYCVLYHDCSIHSLHYIDISSKHITCSIFFLSYDVASESEITPCIQIDKPLVVYTSGLQIFGKRYEMTRLTSGKRQTLTFLRQEYDFKIILMSYDK